MKITDALRGEHGVLHRLLDYTAEHHRCWSLSEVRQAGAWLEQAVASHAAVEDELLFEALAATAAMPSGPLVVMRAEHAEIEGGFERLRSLPDLEAARALLARTVEIAQQHFAKEERVLFPLAEQVVAAAELEQLGALWAERRAVVTA